MTISKNKSGMTTITTEVFQTKNGSIGLNFGKDVVILGRDCAETILYDIEDFNLKDFNKFYYTN